MRDESLKRRTVAATVMFAVFMVLFTLLRDAMGGQPFNLVGSLISAVISALVFGVLYYVLLRRQEATHRA
jgi:hypothetical protein